MVTVERMNIWRARRAASIYMSTPILHLCTLALLTLITSVPSMSTDPSSPPPIPYLSPSRTSVSISLPSTSHHPRPFAIETS